MTALVGFGLLSLSGMAVATRVAVDGSPSPIATVCTAGALTPCGSTSLTQDPLGTPLVANFGFGPFSSVYLYSNGLVSIGAPITPASAGVNPSSLASVPGNVFTAGYVPGVTYNDFEIQGPGASTFYGPGDVNNGKPVVRVLYNQRRIEFSIYDRGSGEYELQYAYGDPFNTNDQFTLAPNGFAGYSFAGSPVVQTNGTDVNTGGTYNYLFRTNVAGAIPEPATWAMLTLGFAGLGAALRSRRRTLAPAG